MQNNERRRTRLHHRIGFTEPPPLVTVNELQRMNALLILNDRAGSINGEKDSATPSAVVEALRAGGIDAELRLAPSANLQATMQAAVRENPPAIFVGGGDGSISTAANCLADTGIPLGVLPLGTLNHFARDLRLPLGWREAVSELAHGEPRAVDVGEVNGRIFINNCSIGSYAEAVRKRDALRHRHGMGKWWAMARATFAVFRRLRRLRVRIEANGTMLQLRTPFVVVSNNRYSGHVLDYSLRPQLDAGRLWIYSTRAHRHGAVLRLIWQSLMRKIDQVEALDQFEVTAATLEHEYPRLPIAIDGEVAELRPTLRFRTRRAALQVIAPRPRPEFP